MKLTLQELNDRIWYRFLKIIHAFLYIALLIFVFFFVKEASHDQLPPQLPKTAIEALEDENFYLLSPDEMMSTLRLFNDDLGYNFCSLPESEQQKFIVEIRQSQKFIKGKRGYVYLGRDEINVRKAVYFAAIYILSFVIFMELIRRSFYYVLTGHLFPKKISSGEIKNTRTTTDSINNGA